MTEAFIFLTIFIVTWAVMSLPEAWRTWKCRHAMHRSHYQIKVSRLGGRIEVWYVAPDDISEISQFLEELEPLEDRDKVEIHESPPEHSRELVISGWPYSVV